MVDEIDLHHVQQTANNNIPPPNFRRCAGLRGHKIKTTTVTPAGFPNITYGHTGRFPQYNITRGYLYYRDSAKIARDAKIAWRPWIQ